MNDFTASNGLRLSLIEGGRLRVATPNGYEGWHKLNLDVPTVEALRQFFEAAADEKPWHDAQPGEIWVVDGTPCAVVARMEQPHTFADPFAREPGIPTTAPGIRRAHRIWPEVRS